MDIQEYISSGIIETYVMGLCSPDEEKELEQLRNTHPELDEAIIVYEKAMEKNMLQQVTIPAADTDSKILKTLSELNKKSVEISIADRKPKRMQLFAIAASLLLFVSMGLNYFLYQQSKKGVSTAANSSLPDRDYQVMNNPRITPVAMYGVGIHTICRCTMFWDKSTGKMYIMIHHLPLSSETKDYHLWASVNGEMVNVGIIRDEIRGRFIELDKVPAGATGFSVTLEKSGDVSMPTINETYLKGEI